MTSSNRFSLASARLVLVAGLAVSGILVMALPAHAATYAYVNTSGDVSMVNANDPVSAMATALNIAIHSGVMLLTAQFNQDMAGDHVSL